MISCPKPVRYVSEEKRAWIRRLPCLLAHESPCRCGGFINPVTRTFVSEAAHVKSRGSGGDDLFLIPLCAAHHRLRGDCVHLAGTKSFERAHAEALEGKSLKQIGRQLHREWLVVQQRGEA